MVSWGVFLFYFFYIKQPFSLTQSQIDLLHKICICFHYVKQQNNYVVNRNKINVKVMKSRMYILAIVLISHFPPFGAPLLNIFRNDLALTKKKHCLPPNWVKIHFIYYCLTEGNQPLHHTVTPQTKYKLKPLHNTYWSTRPHYEKVNLWFAMFFHTQR